MTAEPTIGAIAITVSSKLAHGPSGDLAGDQVCELISRLDGELLAREVLPDDREQIAARLRHWCDQDGCTLILTSGGTGFSPTDITPEATIDVLDRQAPGLAEAMRLASAEHTSHWMLSRAVAGTRGSTLIVNLPGNPKAIPEVGGVLESALPHALALIAGGAPGIHRQAHGKQE